MNIQYSKKFTLLIYLIIVVTLAVATIVESIYDSTFVAENIYHTWWFILLWVLLSFLLIASFVRYKLWRRFSVFLLHLSFVIILVGAFATYASGDRGYVQLREGASASKYISQDKTEKDLPFEIQLIDFRVEHYKGTNTPADYVSVLSFAGQKDSVSMNKILKIDGYRLYQTSFDRDEKGTLLTINYDPYGIFITYLGYLLLGISMLLTLLSKYTRFRSLLKKMLVVASVTPLVSCGSEAFYGDVLSVSQADTIAMMPINYNGRIAPFNTMAEDVVKKVYGKKEYKGLNSDQVLGSFILHPEQWTNEPIIEVKSKALRKLLQIDSKYASINDLYADGKYKLEQWWEPEKQKSPLQKEIKKIDEKISILVMLQKRTLFEPFYGEYSQRKLKAEKLYNRIDVVSMLFKVHLSLGLVAFALFIYMQLSGRKIRFIKSLLAVQVIHSFCFITAIIALRWYVSGHFPVTNGYGTMLFIAWIILAISLVWYRRFDFVPAAALLLSGFALLVCNINSVNPQITSLMPVLNSPWLSSHVTLIMISYALFAFMFFNGIVALILHKKDEQVLKLYNISNILLYPAVFTLTAGIFIGAIWANVSWGRYWAWDAKEVWALITMMVYAVGLHSSSIEKLRNRKAFHIFMVLAFFTVLMTYFGVNYVLGGLHSYAN